MTTVGAITLAIAVLGAVLGLVNTRQSLDRDRVKLRVVAKYAFLLTGHGTSRVPQLAIEIVNRSQFPLTVSQVGLEQHGSKDVLALRDPIMVEGGKLPRRLESRSAFTTYFSVEGTEQALLKNVARAYAKTDCGETAYSSRRAFENVLRQIQGRAKSPTSAK